NRRASGVSDRHLRGAALACPRRPPERLGLRLAQKSLRSSRGHIRNGALAPDPVGGHAHPRPGSREVRRTRTPRGRHRDRHARGGLQPLARSNTMRSTPAIKRFRPDSGEALVEMALVLPILLLLSLG